LTASFGIIDVSETIFSSDALPLVPPSLEGLDLTLTGFSLGSQETGITVGGDLAHLVPEPGTLGLLALGIFVLGWRTRRPKRRLNGKMSAVHIAPVCFLLPTWIGGLMPVQAQEVCGCMDMVFLIDVTGLFGTQSRIRIGDELRSLVEDTAITTSGGDLRLGFITFGGGPGDPLVNVRQVGDS